jgi:SAM-dependent methyltransferase
MSSGRPRPELTASAEALRARRAPEREKPALVSAIVIGANSESLTEAVESVLVQTYPHVEVIVVGTTPRGLARVTANSHAQVRMVEGPSGTAASRNAGLRESSGSFLIFLDASERLLPRALEVGLGEFAAEPECAFVWGKCIVTRPYHEDPEFPQQPLVMADHYAALLARNYVLSPAAALFRREPLEAAGAFDESLEVLEDYDLYLRLAREFRVRCHTATTAVSPANDPLRSDREAARPALARILEKQRIHVERDRHLAHAYEIGKQLWTERYKVMHESIPPSEAELGGPGDVTAGGLRGQPPPPGLLRFGDFRRVTPLSTNFGYERGAPIDRYYIESFLAEHAEDVHGRVLEVQENAYSRRFGGSNVEVSDVLSLLPDNPRATIVADLSEGEEIPSDCYDCAIVTQVLHLIPDPRKAVRTVHRILRPGGVALITVPGISQVEWAETWYWSFTILSAQALFADVFGGSNVRARAYGNVLAATSFLWGMAVEELDDLELDYPDPYYQVTVAVRAIKEDGSLDSTGGEDRR